jgi:DNA topoisomerase-1
LSCSSCRATSANRTAKRGASYASLAKEDDPYTIELERAVFLLDQKEEIARNRIIKSFDGSEIQVLNGRYGAYISDGKLNGRIPKDREPASLTLEEVTQMMADTGKPMRKGFGKKAVKKAPAKKAKAAAADATAKKAVKKTAAKKATKKVAKKAAGSTVTKKTAAAGAVKKAPAKKASAKKAPAAAPVTPAAPPSPAEAMAARPVAGRKVLVKKPADNDAPF